jgi:hypothetical protein
MRYWTLGSHRPNDFVTLHCLAEDFITTHCMDEKGQLLAMYSREVDENFGLSGIIGQKLPPIAWLFLLTS